MITRYNKDASEQTKIGQRPKSYWIYLHPSTSYVWRPAHRAILDLWTTRPWPAAFRAHQKSTSGTQKRTSNTRPTLTEIYIYRKKTSMPWLALSIGVTLWVGIKAFDMVLVHANIPWICLIILAQQRQQTSYIRMNCRSSWSEHLHCLMQHASPFQCSPSNSFMFVTASKNDFVWNPLDCDCNGSQVIAPCVRNPNHNNHVSLI